MCLAGGDAHGLAEGAVCWESRHNPPQARGFPATSPVAFWRTLFLEKLIQGIQGFGWGKYQGSKKEHGIFGDLPDLKRSGALDAEAEKLAQWPGV